jgi:GR25 family glycosyltransferase involved in LPS biosynthesis
MLNIKDVYVIHYTKLESRRNKITEQFENISHNLHFINDFDQEDITPEIMNEFYLYSITEWDKKVSPLWNINSHRPRLLNIAEISCTIKHVKAIEFVSKNGDAFIIEDDLIIKDDFLNEFNNAIDRLPDDWDVVMIGTGCNLTSKNIQPGKIFYKQNHPATRCLDSYLLKQSAAKKIIETIKPFQLVSDWELAYHLYFHNLNVYWLEPSPCFQGSEKGIYKSTLDFGNNR